MRYGKPPTLCGFFPMNLKEVMYYLYLPVQMRTDSDEIRLPPNVECCRPLIEAAIASSGKEYRYVYLSARKGWATPDNPLNRPGWHCDGFGTDDMNFVWWQGPGTRFAVHPFKNISKDHVLSQQQFAEQIIPNRVVTYAERHLYGIAPDVVHATPEIGMPGCMRQYVKVSLSDHRYNLENNSHNYLFSYDWPLHKREEIRNDPASAQTDYKEEK